MKKNILKKFVAVVSVVSVMFAMGVTSYAGETSDSTAASGKTAIWNILTEEQKETLNTQMKEQLAQDLADGKITQDRYDEMLAAIESGEMPTMGKNASQRKGMNGENSETYEAMQEQWAALTDEQKSEIYALTDSQSSIEAQIIDKYLEFGIIDSATAETMKSNLETRNSNMRTNGGIPMMKGGGRGGQPPTQTTTGE